MQRAGNTKNRIFHNPCLLVIVTGMILECFLLRGINKDAFFNSTTLLSFPFLFTVLFEQILPSLLSFSLKDALERHCYREMIQKSRMFQLVFVIVGVCFAIVFFFISEYFLLSSSQEVKEELILACRVSCIGILLNGLLSNKYCWYIAQESKKISFLGSSMEQIFMILSICVFWNVFQENAFLWIAISAIIGKGCSYIYFLFADRISYHAILQAARKQSKSSKLSFQNEILSPLFQGIGVGGIWMLFMGELYIYFQSLDSPQTGNEILICIGMLAYLPSAISYIMMESSLNHFLDWNHKKEVTQYLYKAYRPVLFVSIFCSIFLIGCADWMANVFFENVEMYWIVIVCACIGILLSLLINTFLFLKKLHLDRTFLPYCVIGGLTQVLCNLFIFPSLKEIGGLLSIVTGLIVILFLCMTKIANKYDNTYEDLYRRNWKVVLCAIAGNGIYALLKFSGILAQDYSVIFCLELIGLFVFELIVFIFTTNFLKVAVKFSGRRSL